MEYNSLVEPTIEPRSKNEVHAPEVNDDHVYNDMIAWLEAGGARFPKLAIRRYAHDYRGVHATESIDDDEVIVLIPRRFIMTTEHARQTPSGSRLSSSGVPLRSRHTFLSTYLLEERERDDQSYWAPYIRVLPRDYYNMPINFSEEELSQLRGSFTFEKIDARICSLQDEFHDVCQVLPDFSKRFSFLDFVWARNVVITRVFGLMIDGIKTEGLVPMADLLNHKRPRDTKWTFDNRVQAFTVTSLQPIGIDQVVSDSYGRKCNSRFFVNYGFSLENNPDNEAVMIISHPNLDARCQSGFDMQAALESIPQTQIQMLSSMPLGNAPLLEFASEHIRSICHHMLDRVRESWKKVDLECMAMGIEPSLLRRSFQIPANTREKKASEMFTFLRLIVATEDEIETLRLRRLNCTSSASFTGSFTYFPPLSIRNELAVLDALELSSNEALAAFDASIVEDNRLLEDEGGLLTNNARNSILMRRGEKRVCTYYRDLARYCRPLLLDETASALESRFEILQAGRSPNSVRSDSVAPMKLLHDFDNVELCSLDEVQGLNSARVDVPNICVPALDREITLRYGSYMIDVIRPLLRKEAESDK